jgi:uncharacterized membrane protein
MKEARLGVHRAAMPKPQYRRGATIDANAGLKFIQKRIAEVMEDLNEMRVSPDIQGRTSPRVVQKSIT